LTAEAVVSSFVRQIKNVNPGINAVVQPEVFDDALNQAIEKDRELKRGDRIGPLHGVPVTIKECLETTGTLTTAGAPRYRDHVSTKDATVVSRLRDAGAIVLGKTNVPMLSAALETDNLIYKRTNNPYDLQRTPGGSSGGEAAILAASGSPLGIGIDAGASIRVPAHFCGVAGLCPSYGRVSTAGTWPPSENRGMMWYSAVGPMSRHVEDLALVLPIISGLDDRDPFTFALKAIDRSPVDITNLRIAYWIGDDNVQPSEDTRKTVDGVATFLREQRVNVMQIAPPFDLAKFSRLLIATVVGDDVTRWRQMIEENGGADDLLMQKQLDAFAMLLSDFSKKEKSDLRAQLPIARASVTASMSDFDAVICPVTKTPAVRHMESVNDISNFDYPGLMGISWSLPSGTVRCGTSADSELPIGVQVVGRPNREDIVLAILKMLERGLGGWRAP
jgi:amidase